MNPKISIVVDAKNKAVVSLTGIVSVGAKVDVEISGLPDAIPDWSQSDKFTGKSLRFRVVSFDGKDVVRYPLSEKTSEPASSGDTWTVSQTGNVYSTSSGCFVDFNTEGMRRAFAGSCYDETMDFGIVLDSIVDSAEYAVGKIRIRQWSKAGTEDPTVLPDWRETLADLNTALGQVSTSAATASSAATAAQSAKTSAESARDAAGTYANAALGYQNAAIAQANTATEKANLAAGSAESAAGYAAHYPYVNQVNKHWMVWNANKSPTPGFDDTGIVAEGVDGEDGEDGAAATVSVGTVTTGAAGSDASVTNVGTSSAAVFNFAIPRGPKGDTGDDGEDGSIVTVSGVGTATDEVKYITIDGVEKRIAGGDMSHAEFDSLDEETSTIADIIRLLKGQNND